jgi:hypothetical protein
MICLGYQRPHKLSSVPQKLMAITNAGICRGGLQKGFFVIRVPHGWSSLRSQCDVAAANGELTSVTIEYREELLLSQQVPA